MISDNFQLFLDLNPPQYSEYQKLNDFKYDKTKINDILNQKFISFESFAASKNWDIKYNYYTYQTEYISIKNAQIKEREEFYSKFADSLNVTSHFNYYESYFGSYEAEIMSCFNNWKKNKELRIFIQKIQDNYDQII